MQFQFDEDQLLLRDTMRDFLDAESPVERVRSLWETETGRSTELWTKLAEIGLPGLLVPEEYGGLGLSEIDSVLVFVEIGRAALAEPLVSTAAVAVPLLVESGNSSVAAEWLPRIAGGEAIVAVALSGSPLVADAHIADLLILREGDSLRAVPRDAVQLTPQPSNDPSQKLFTVEVDAGSGVVLAMGDEADRLEAAAIDRGALACAAQQLGACEKMIDLSVEYSTERRQFGVPIGSFQAVKHLVADRKVALEYARSHVERAAHSVANAQDTRAVDVSMAKISASEAAVDAGRVSLQVHGALGYTWEQDLHVWMRRAWTFDLAWGDQTWHRARLAGALFEAETPARSFGYSPPAA